MTTSSEALVTQRIVEIAAGRQSLVGILSKPTNPLGVVVFSHGSGSGRFSPRNHFVAKDLHGVGLATLLVDLLTEDEEGNQETVFDIPLLARRLLSCVEWVRGVPRLVSLPVGLIGASTGAAAALLAVAKRPEWIHAVVSRGGRPDLAHQDLPRVHAPTLLIVGGQDREILDLNQESLALLTTTKELFVVPGATHLFDESGALEMVARVARDWFIQYLFRSSSEGQSTTKNQTVRAADELNRCVLFEECNHVSQS